MHITFCPEDFSYSPAPVSQILTSVGNPGDFSDEIRKRPVFYPTDLVIDSSASYTAGCAKHLLSVYDAFISLSFCLRDSQTLPSAYTFGTLYGILQRANQIQSCSFWGTPESITPSVGRSRFPASFSWRNMQL